MTPRFAHALVLCGAVCLATVAQAIPATLDAVRDGDVIRVTVRAGWYYAPAAWTGLVVERTPVGL